MNKLMYANLFFLALIVLVMFYLLTFQTPELKKGSVFTATSQELTTRLAENKMQDLIVTSHWSHTNSNGCDFNCRVREAGITKWQGENLYTGNTCDIRYAMELWEESPTHKAILDSQYTYGTMLIQTDNVGDCYIVLDVGK